MKKNTSALIIGLGMLLGQGAALGMQGGGQGWKVQAYRTNGEYLRKDEQQNHFLIYDGNKALSVYKLYDGRPEDLTKRVRQQSNVIWAMCSLGLGSLGGLGAWCAGGGKPAWRAALACGVGMFMGALWLYRNGMIFWDNSCNEPLFTKMADVTGSTFTADAAFVYKRKIHLTQGQVDVLREVLPQNKDTIRPELVAYRLIASGNNSQ